jgi:hypothetical protein
MRNAAWMTTAILMFGCAQAAPGEDPAGDPGAGAITPAPDGGPPETPDAGFRACDPHIPAAEGVTISETGACPGMMPAAADCAAELTLCSGGTDDNATTVSAATSDGRGSVVLSCHRMDVGPPVINLLFVPTRSGFVSKAGLGVDVKPLSDGFVASQGSYVLPPPEYHFLAHDGTLRAAHRGGTLFASATRAVILRASEGQLVADSFTADGAPAATTVVATYTGSTGSLMMGGAMNASGATLLLWQVYGEANASARWLAADGTLSGPQFSISGWSSSVPATAALAGGGIAVAAQPPSGVRLLRWRGVIAPGETVERPAPAWLTSRADFFLLPGGKAMAFGNEIVGADGTLCGRVDLGAPMVGVGVDGTAFTARSLRTFRIYPQLFR